VRPGSVLAKRMKTAQCVATYNGIETWAYRGKLYSVDRKVLTHEKKVK
jgi:hypothetical protein